jgi:hypothetical protein
MAVFIFINLYAGATKETHAFAGDVRVTMYHLAGATAVRFSGRLNFKEFRNSRNLFLGIQYCGFETTKLKFVVFNRF